MTVIKTRNLLQIIALLLLVVSSWAFSQDNFPQLLEKNQYQFKTRGLSAKMFRAVEQVDDTRFKVTSTAKHSLVSVVEYCIFKEDANGTIVPLEYSYRMKSLFGGRRQFITFDWDTMKAQAKYKGKTVEINLQSGYQTYLTMQLQMLRDLQKGVEQFNYQVVRKHSVKDYYFASLGTQLLPIGGLERELVQLQRKRDQKAVNIWVDPADGYKMMRMQVSSRKDGKASIEFIKKHL